MFYFPFCRWKHFHICHWCTQRLGHLLRGTWLLHGGVRIWTQGIWTPEPMFFTCHILLHVILIIFKTMKSLVQTIEARIEEGSLVKVLADLFSGWKIPLLSTTHRYGHGHTTLLLPNSKPPRARKCRIRYWMS